ncbi:MAG: ATPase, T2SS/T4P/T4SS family [Planctomycetota bacterium]
MPAATEVDSEARAGIAEPYQRIDALPASVSSLYVERVPIVFARRHGLLGFRGEREDVLLVSAQPLREDMTDGVARLLGKPVHHRVLATDDADEQIAAATNAAYRDWGHDASSLASVAEKGRGQEPSSTARVEDLLDASGRAPVIQVVNALLLEASRVKASDIHLQPTADKLIVRMRVDGVLEDRHSLPTSIRDETVSRVKVMAGMNVAERRLPQDGRTSVDVGGREIDLRISSVPSADGERIVVRLLDQTSVLLSLDGIGMEPDTLARYQRVIAGEHGIVLVTGPTGSGKTTTLYASLMSMDRTTRNVLTLEDPVEYRLPGVSQAQINDRIGFTFASGLRNILRQDPDVIMLGEIRDHETAVMAMQSSLTGHLVLSTLHTNDAASSVTRLFDLGLEPYLVASSLRGALAQRLVRCVCSECGRTRAATDTERAWLGCETADPIELREGGGCASCRETGFSGRAALFELIDVDEPMRASIQASASLAELRAAASARGCQTLRESARSRVCAGLTTVAEAERVTSAEAV